MHVRAVSIKGAVSPYQVFLTKDYLAIAMEYAAGGDMFQYVKQRGGLEELEARWFFQQLIIGMDYCHKMVRYSSGP
jgi:serine/threonine-protein kinase SRK2